MKLEMGESLIYSWLRHVKACRIVQTNWKPSATWELQTSDKLETMLKSIDESFNPKFGSIFKKNVGLSQLLKQCECDLIGLSLRDGKNFFFAVEVAFHSGGINYGNKDYTTAKILEKMARAAFCLKGFFCANDGEIIFASPKIYPNVEEILVPAVKDLQQIFNDHNFNFNFGLMYNNTFNEKILNPVIKLCDEDTINDTSELFARSYKLYSMFVDGKKNNVTDEQENLTNGDKAKSIGNLVKEDFRRLLAAGAADEREVQDMQDATLSKKNFHCNYPVLSKTRDDSNKSRYYAEPVWIRGEKFFICNDWYERSTNNDRPYLLKWFMTHSLQTN